MATHKVKGTAESDGTILHARMAIRKLPTVNESRGMTGTPKKRSASIDVPPEQYDVTIRMTAAPGTVWRASLYVDGQEKKKSGDRTVDNSGSDPWDTTLVVP